MKDLIQRLTEDRVKGIPFSKFVEGAKVELERVSVYSHNAPHSSGKVVLKVITEVVQGDTGMFVRFKGDKKLYRLIGRGGVVQVSAGHPKLVKYDVVGIR